MVLFFNQKSPNLLPSHHGYQQLTILWNHKLQRKALERKYRAMQLTCYFLMNINYLDFIDYFIARSRARGPGHHQK